MSQKEQPSWSNLAPDQWDRWWQWWWWWQDGHLAGEMVDLVCVLAFCELPVEQRNIFVRLVFQHLWIMMMQMIIILVEQRHLSFHGSFSNTSSLFYLLLCLSFIFHPLTQLIFHVYNLYFSENICMPTSTLSPPFLCIFFIWNICTPTSTPSPPPVSFFDASATE